MNWPSSLNPGDANIADSHGRAHPLLGTLWNNLGMYQRGGLLDEALKAFSRAGDLPESLRSNHLRPAWSTPA